MISSIHAPALCTLELHSIYDDQHSSYLMEPLATNRGGIQILVVNSWGRVERVARCTGELEEIAVQGYMSGARPRVTLSRNRGICPKLERFKMNELDVDAVVPTRSAFRMGDVTTCQ